MLVFMVGFFFFSPAGSYVRAWGLVRLVRALLVVVEVAAAGFAARAGAFVRGSTRSPSLRGSSSMLSRP